MEIEMTKNAVIYVRVSTDAQVDGYSFRRSRGPLSKRGGPAGV